MDNCCFLYIGNGICPYHTKYCDKPCKEYAIIGDSSKEIFHNWNNGIEKLALEMKHKYFEKAEDTSNIPVKTVSKENDAIDDISEFLGGFE